MKLIDARFCTQMLYDLLAERPSFANISHHEMPTFNQHVSFVMSAPYAAWYAAQVGDDLVGAVYLTHQDEIGVGILRQFQRNGYATEAIKMLMGLHPRKRYLANINPENLGSIKMFGSLGFSHIQNTYEVRNV